jgi:hypothetical protein
VNTEDPRMRAELQGNHSIRLEWENTPETVIDPITGEQHFCGYRIWRVEGWTRPYGSAGPAPDEWQLIADISPEPAGYQLDLADHTNANAKILQSVASPIDPEETYDIYEIGRYFYEDRAGLKNGMLYFYDIVSYSCWYAGGEYLEMSQPPAALEQEGVCPRWDAVRDGSWKDRVAVVPNPYRGGAAWDLTPSSADPLGTHIDFINLPNRTCRIGIYSLAGDLVRSFGHDGRSGVGSVAWNLLSRNGQEIVSGVYLYAVTCGDETVVGRFTVIR